MSRMLLFLNRASRAADRTCRSAAVGFFAVMLIIVLFQVVARYVFQSVPVWTEELARYCMVWGGFLGATAAFKGEQDPRLIQPPQTGNRVWVLAAFFIRAAGTVVFLGPVLYFCDRFLARTWVRSTEALEIPTAIVTSAVPLMICIIFFHLFVRIVNTFLGRDPEEGMGG
jgi:TRAP-type C4-dicarboxylate transport system permease small subunit